MDSKIKDENYYVVHGWLKNSLGLKGTKRDIYAIIFGFSQDGECEFTGSIKYFEEWLDVKSIAGIDGKWAYNKTHRYYKRRAV